jgi:tRNA(Ile)-lysidine synthase
MATRKTAPPPPPFVAKWPRDGRYLVGVSGGLDSMVLWHALREAGYRGLVVVHIDHGLRGAESAADAEFVRAEAGRLATPCEIRRVDARTHAKARKLSLEAAARELRYGAFAEVARPRGCHELFLAHHADDRVETVLMHLFRGAGSRGLSGMAEESRRRIDGIGLTLIRPLLRTSREALAKYAAVHGVAWREDASNASGFTLRNRIRHRLLPEIEAVFGRDARTAILRAADLAALDEAWAAEQLGELPRSPADRGLEVAAMRSRPAAARRRLLLAWLRAEAVPDCGLAEVERAEAVLLASGRPAKASLPGGHHVRRRAGLLFIEPPERG